MYKMLFVCTGNICRSPTADGMLQHYIQKHSLHSTLYSDSAGIEGYHTGESPDHRAIAMAQKHGIDLSHISARQVTPHDFQQFDLILAMDNGHYQHLLARAPASDQHKIALFLDYTNHPYTKNVPDPYYGTEKDFQHSFNLIEYGVQTLLQPYVTIHDKDDNVLTELG